MVLGIRMTTIIKTQVVSTVYQEFYNLLNNNISNPHTGRTHWIYPNYPEEDIPVNASNDKIRNYFPIIIVSSPNINWTNFTFTSKKVSGTIAIEIHHTKSKNADNYADEIINTIEIKRAIMRADGLRFIQLNSVDASDNVIGQIIVHVRTITFSFEYLFEKTQTW